MIQLYKSVKLAFDDKLILNPGKVVGVPGRPDVGTMKGRGNERKEQNIN